MGYYTQEQVAPGDYTHVYHEGADPNAVVGFDPVKLGLTEIRGGGGPSGGEGGVADSWANGWFKEDPTDSNKQLVWDDKGNFTGSHVKKSGWVSARDTAVIPLGKMALMAFAPYLAPYMPAAQLGLEAGSMGAAALNGATVGGVTAGLTGGNIGQGMLTGGLGGAAFNAAGQYLTPSATTGDMGQWYDGYSGPASDAGYRVSSNFTDADILNNAGHGAFNVDPYSHSDLPGFTASDPSKIDINLGEPSGGLTQSQQEAINNIAIDGKKGMTDYANTLGETARDVRGYDGEPTGGTGSNTSDAFPNGTPSVDVQKSVWEKLGDKVMDKFIDPKTGDINWSAALAAAGLVTSVVGKLTASDPPPVKTISELTKQVMPKDFNTPWAGGALSKAAPWNTRARTYSADMPTPIVAGRRYAEGGEVEGALSTSAPFVGFVQGAGGGQDDLIDANLSAGEYVFDAESVSMLGDGNNEEGARKLDELRQSLRAHKRSAPNNEIAPPAQGALSYMNGGQ